MSEMELLSSLIGDIYDATLDAALWPMVLGKCADFVGGVGASFYSKNTVTRTIDIAQGVGIPEEYVRSYVTTYAGVDPTSTALFFFGVDEIVGTLDMLPYEEFAETRFYKEWARPQQLVDSAQALLEKAGSSYSTFNVFRHERNGFVDDACRRQMGLLVPHVRRAVMISKAIELRQTEAATLADTLDTLAAGMFLVNSEGRLMHANQSGQALLADETLLRASGGRLLATGEEAGRALRNAYAGAEGGDAGLGVRGVAVPLDGGDGQHYVAHVLPLTSGARRQAGVRYEAAAAIFVCSARIAAPAMPEVIARLYGLTPSELRVLLAVFESGGVPDIAQALGIAEFDGQDALSRLFEKTGTGRQADLVKLVAGFTGPDR